jgi:hypothetical protein
MYLITCCGCASLLFYQQAMGVIAGGGGGEEKMKRIDDDVGFDGHYQLQDMPSPSSHDASSRKQKEAEGGGAKGAVGGVIANGAGLKSSHRMKSKKDGTNYEAEANDRPIPA